MHVWFSWLFAVFSSSVVIPNVINVIVMVLDLGTASVTTVAYFTTLGPGDAMRPHGTGSSLAYVTLGQADGSDEIKSMEKSKWRDDDYHRLVPSDKWHGNVASFQILVN